MTQQPEPEFVTFHGGPMDGYRAPVTGWTPEQRAEGTAHISPNSAYGPGGRSMYGPPDDDPLAEAWEWQGDVP